MHACATRLPASDTHVAAREVENEGHGACWRGYEVGHTVGSCAMRWLDHVRCPQFFCAGGVVRHWAALGFSSVIHRNRDFYADIQSGQLPEYDVMVTNPP